MAKQLYASGSQRIACFVTGPLRHAGTISKLGGEIWKTKTISVAIAKIPKIPLTKITAVPSASGETSLRPPRLKPKAAFLHVINDHRWLVAGGCSWNLLMANNGKNDVRTAADALLPDVVVAVRDCVLLQARSLIDFYTKCHARETDILLCDFNGLSIEPALKDALEGYKQSIEVHLLHLTAWRDLDYRTKHATGQYANATRRDWNKEVAPLAASILAALKCASEKSSRWSKPFTDLYEASLSRYQNKSFDWPPYLGEKLAVVQYLDKCGL
jgi:hypothetical protein